MKYQEFLPGERLRPYIKCYYYFESETSASMQDIVFPSGNMEVIFNLGEGMWQSAVNGVFYKTPPIELWGQITRPLAVQAQGNNKMLGIKFYVHSAAFFFREHLSVLNDQVADARDLMGADVNVLHQRLLNEPLLEQRVAMVEHFLQDRLLEAERREQHMRMIGQVVKELQHDVLADDIKTLASRYDVTPRYLQKLFLQYTGLTPKFYHKINRFQLSLKLVAKREHSLTAIAYDCGYFDQSHFIREFKSFTGTTPSNYTNETFPVSLALSNS